MSNVKAKLMKKLILTEISGVPDGSLPANQYSKITFRKTLDTNDKNVIIDKNNTGGNAMADENKSEDLKAEIAKLNTDISSYKEICEKLQKETEFLKKISSLTVDEKTHYESLGDNEKELFLKMSSEDKKTAIRDNEIKKTLDQAKEKVVYKSLDGIQYTQKDDPRVVEMARQFDVQKSEIQKMKDSNKEAELTAISKNFGFLTKDDNVQKSLAKAFVTLTDKEQEGLLTVFKKQETLMKEIEKTYGKTSSVNVENELEKEIKKTMSNLTIGYDEAFTKVWEARPDLRDVFREENNKGEA